MTDIKSINDEDDEVRFLPLTDELLTEFQRRFAEDEAAKKKQKGIDGDAEVGVEKNEDSDDLWPEYWLESGNTLPFHLKERFPRDLSGIPLKEIDPYYQTKQTCVVVNRCGTIYRFSTAKVLWVMDPLNFARRMALSIIVHPIFKLIMNLFIIANCCMLICNDSPAKEAAKRFFTSVYTVEFVLLVLAKGFVLHPFSYLRDGWLWLDFIVLLLEYIHFTFHLSIYFGVLRAIRLLRVIGTTTRVPGMRILVRGLYESVLNLREALVVALFFLGIFALAGLHLYMGVLQEKRIWKIPNEQVQNLTTEEPENIRRNSTDCVDGICGLANDTQMCPENYRCYEGDAGNPDYGYTSFDTYGLSLLSTLCVMTWDFWENVMQLIIKAAGPWNVLFFMLVIFISRHLVYNLILSSIILSYQELQRIAEMDEQSEMEDKEARRRNSELNDVNKEGSEDNFALSHTMTTPVIQDEDKNDWKQQPQTTLSKIVRRLCVWECCGCWTKFQGLLRFVLYDAFTEIFLFLCVIISTIILAIDHHGMDHHQEADVRKGTQFFAVIFGLEVVLKMIASSPYNFFQELRHIYEFFVLLFTFPAYTVEDYDTLEIFVKILVILRRFRLFRIFRLARASCTFRCFINVMTRCIFPFSVLCLVFFIIAFIFAILGMEFFAEDYEINAFMFSGEEIPFWNFTDFMHSFLIVLRALFSEWIESMWDCMLVSNRVCVPYFLLLAVFSSILVFTTFFCIVYIETDRHNGNCDCNAEKTDFTVIVNRFKRFKMCCYKNPTVIPAEVNGIRNIASNEGDRNAQNSTIISGLSLEETTNRGTPDSIGSTLITVLSKDEDSLTKVECTSIVPRTNDADQQTQLVKSETEGDKENCAAEESDTGVLLCCPSVCYKFTSCCNESVWRPWDRIRHLAIRLINHPTWEIAMVICIVISTVSLAMEDKYLKERPKLECAVKYIAFAAEVIFLLDMLIKWIGLGFKSYFTCAWLWVDFVNIVISLIIYISSICCSRVLLKPLQSLRPLRLVPRMQGVRVYANALILLMPTLLCLLIFCFTIWLVFSLIGVALFGGKFAYCVTSKGYKSHYNETPTRISCDMQTEYTWKESDINFNDVGSGLLALWQVATLKGWISIIQDAANSREEKDLQPIDGNNIYTFFYFLTFIIIGCLFTFNLFASVVIQGLFKMLKKQAGDSLLSMTSLQQNYLNSMSAMESCMPRPAPSPNQGKVQATAYKIISNKWFDIAVTICFSINLALKALYYYRMNQTYADVLKILDNLFILVYIVECVIKIMGLRSRYFKDFWNVYDLVVVILAVIDVFIPDRMAKYFIPQPIFLRLIKLLRVPKVSLMLMDTGRFKGIRVLYATFASTIPALLVIILLQFIITTVYALFGMSLFKDVKYGGPLDEEFNFSTYGRAITILFQISTTAGWDGFLGPLMNQNNCTAPYGDAGSDCGNATIAIIYLISYLIIMYLIIFKLYTAIVIQNYNGVTGQVVEGLTTDDYQSFYDTWQKYDPSETLFVEREVLGDLLDELSDPLRMPKPNKYKIVNMDLPIYEGQIVYAKDIMEALTRDFFARRGENTEELTDEIRFTGNGNHGKKVISATLMRQREDCAAQVIQRNWNSYHNGKIEEVKATIVEPTSPGSKSSSSQLEEPKVIESVE